MADILIRGMEMPKTCCQCDIKIYDPELRWDENGIEQIGAWVCKRTREIIWNTQRGENCPLVHLPEGHGDLIERKALNLFPDYKEVRNGIKRTIKEAERDGRAITGVSIDLLKQTLVALDSIRSVRRYFMNAKTIVPADVTDNYVGSKSEEGETDDSKM